MNSQTPSLLPDCKCKHLTPCCLELASSGRAGDSFDALINVDQALQNCLYSGTLTAKAVDYMRRQLADIAKLEASRE